MKLYINSLREKNRCCIDKTSTGTVEPQLNGIMTQPQLYSDGCGKNSLAHQHRARNAVIPQLPVPQAQIILLTVQAQTNVQNKYSQIIRLIWGIPLFPMHEQYHSKALVNLEVNKTETGNIITLQSRIQFLHRTEGKSQAAFDCLLISGLLRQL